VKLHRLPAIVRKRHESKSRSIGSELEQHQSDPPLKSDSPLRAEGKDTLAGALTKSAPERKTFSVSVSMPSRCL